LFVVSDEIPTFFFVFFLFCLLFCGKISMTTITIKRKQYMMNLFFQRSQDKLDYCLTYLLFKKFEIICTIE
jgi:hypothetical protein